MPAELQITFDDLREQNVEQLKILNRAVFPIKYQVSIVSMIIKPMKNSLKRVTTRASYSDWRFCSEHCCLHSVILSGQDRIYQDILASGGVTQLGADLAESRHLLL